MRHPLRIAPALAAGIALAVAASAHHSYAMFDMAKEVTWTGTVDTFQWGNPHVWIYVDVQATPDDPARAGRWGFEGPSSNILARQGFSRNALAHGDKITVVGHPVRDGSKVASFSYIVDKDGNKMYADPGSKKD